MQVDHLLLAVFLSFGGLILQIEFVTFFYCGREFDMEKDVSM